MSALEPGERPVPIQPTRIELLEAFLAAYDADAGVDAKTGIARSTYQTRQAVLRARDALGAQP